MKTEFTPGPWEADHCTEHRIKDDPGHWQIDGPTPMGLNNTMPYTVADTSNRNYCISPEEDKANALLIAAAPDLLELLKQIQAAWLSIPENVQVPDELNSDYFWLMVKDAIAKAEGAP